MPREPWAYIPAEVLENQKRAETAKTWADAQRRSLAAEWAAMHERDALDTLGSVQPTTQEPQQTPNLGGVTDTTALTPFDDRSANQGQFGGALHDGVYEPATERYLGPSSPGAPWAGAGAGVGGPAAPMGPLDVVSGAVEGVPSALGEGVRALESGARSLPFGNEAVDWLQERGRNLPEDRRLAARQARGETLTPEEEARADAYTLDMAAMGSTGPVKAAQGFAATAKGAAQEVAESAGGRAVGAVEEAVGGAVKGGAEAVRRFFHGTGSAFDAPDAAKFDPDGLFGPGYYLTSDPRVAESYANARTKTRLPDNMLREAENRIVQLRSLVDGGAFDKDPVWKRRTEDEIARMQALFKPETGPNIRAVDVPEGLNLLDADARVTPDVIESVGQGMVSVFGRMGRIALDREAAGRKRLTGQDLYSIVRSSAARQKAMMGGGFARGGADETNAVLQAAGYDGIKHTGGKRVPMKDDAGNAIEHDVVVVFPEALPKIRNAISGTPMGAAAGIDVDEEGELGFSPERAALGAVAGSLLTRGRGAGRPQVTGQLPLPMTLPAQPGSSVYDKVAVVRMAGMLSGTATHLLNTAANTVSGLSDLIAKPFQVGADALASAATGTARERYMAEWLPQIGGFAAGALTGLKQVPAILAKGADDPTLAKFDARRFASGSKVLDAAAELPLRLLAASDAVFRGGAFGGHAAALAVRQATREGLSGPARAARTQEILGDLSSHPGLLESANKLAARAVFQESRTEVDELLKLRQGKGRVFFDVFMPFVRTPYNVAAQGAGMTPAGYAAAIKAAMGARSKAAAEAKLAAGGVLTPGEKAALDLPAGLRGEAVDRAVRATAGTLALYVGWNLAAAGLMTGAYPEDQGMRSTLPEGWKPYSLRIPAEGGGATYVPVASLGALSVPLGISANLFEANAKGTETGDPMKGVYSAVDSIGKYMFDLSALQGLSAVSKLFSESERTAERFTENLASSFVPGGALIRQAQQAAGEPQRDPEGPVEAFKAGVPGLSGDVPPKQTALGQPRERGPSGPAAFVVGSRVGVEKPDSVLSALREAKVGIPEPPKQVSHENVKDIPLTDADRREYRRVAGEELSKVVQRYVANPKWAQGTPAQKAEVLEQAMDAVREKAKLAILAKLGKDEIKRRLARRPAA